MKKVFPMLLACILVMMMLSCETDPSAPSTGDGGSGSDEGAYTIVGDMKTLMGPFKGADEWTLEVRNDEMKEPLSFSGKVPDDIMDDHEFGTFMPTEGERYYFTLKTFVSDMKEKPIGILEGELLLQDEILKAHLGEKQPDPEPPRPAKPEGKLLSLSCKLELDGQPEAYFTGYSDPEAEPGYTQGTLVRSDLMPNVWLYAIIGGLTWYDGVEPPDAYLSSFENVKVDSHYENGFTGDDGKSKLILVKPDGADGWEPWSEETDGYDHVVRPALTDGTTYFVFRPVKIQKSKTLKKGTEPIYAFSEDGDIRYLKMHIEGEASPRVIVNDEKFVSSSDKGKMAFILNFADGTTTEIYLPNNIYNMTGDIVSVSIAPRKGRMYDIHYTMDKASCRFVEINVANKPGSGVTSYRLYIKDSNDMTSVYTQNASEGETTRICAYMPTSDVTYTYSLHACKGDDIVGIVDGESIDITGTSIKLPFPEVK